MASIANVTTRPVPDHHVESSWKTLSQRPSSRSHEHGRNTFYHHDNKTSRAMGTPHQPKWPDRFPFLPLHWRITNLRNLAVFALAAFAVSLFLFECRRDISETAGTEIIDAIKHSLPAIPEADVTDVAIPKVPGQCTTWPVTARGGYKSRIHNPNLALQSFAPPGGWKKPRGIAVKALIFYGRKRTVDFLDCYIQKNLDVNGGYLDEVWFMIHTDIEEDLVYLKELVLKRPQYRLVFPGDCEGFNFACMWDPVVEDDTIYVKIDDDIVFIHPDTIPQLVSTRIAEPHPFAVSANLVNSPLTGYKHYDVGAIHPFLPDPNDRPSQQAAQLWRPSDFRTYPKGKLQKVGGNDTHYNINEEIAKKYLEAGPHYEGHPWLSLEGTKNALLKTPMGIAKLAASVASDGGDFLNGNAWSSWKISAQQQYSLLRNLEQNTMWRYHFGTRMDYPQGVNSSADAAALKFFDPSHLGPGAEQLFDTGYVRYNLNFIAVWGHDIKHALPIGGDDEQEITATIPERLQRPFVIDTRAVVSHLSYYPQHDGVRQTDLLDRWRAVANELVCSVDDQKIPFDPLCPGY